ncbi:receptor-like protein 9DC3 [Ricinus communis]|uniref:receptor-like protein 9DC3 n=1 Tax=Ricinus communis TaxID=3988 RepID=UPI00201A2F86|nr:receptor-like protein 9DC3 [Ricinus communis]
MASSVFVAHFLCFLLFQLHFIATCFPSFSFNSSSSTPLCHYDQSLALLQFKNSFPISKTKLLLPNSKTKISTPKTESWKEGTNCCYWDGVTCDIDTGNVIGLNLSYSLLYGTISSNNSLFFLSHLQKLDLSGNFLNQSQILPQFGQFIALTHLYLNYSDFSGQIPREISHLSNLISLNLSWNDLSLEATTFSKIFQNLTRLQALDLSYVDLSLVGPSSYMNLSSSLSSLSLKDCGLRGKVAFAHLPELLSLILSFNDNLTFETATFDMLVQNLSKLQELDLSYTNMSLVAPTSLMNLSSSFLWLGFENCGLTGRLPDNIFQLQNLQGLDLGGNNYLTGSLPRYNWNSSLRFLSLSETQIPVYLEHDFFKNLKSLTAIDLTSCHFVGSDLSLFGNLSQLTDLYLSSNNFSGQISPSFESLKNLSRLHFNNNYLSGQIPNYFTNFTRLEELDLSNNRFIGPIPSQVGRLQSLVFLSLSNNHLNGQIPHSFESLENLSLLLLDNNHLSGQIPNYFTNFTRLKGLDLSNNRFIGPIPSQVGRLQSLFFLSLSNNHLNATIPSSLFTLPYIGYLNLSNNLLTGHMDHFISDSLYSVDLSNNLLNGPIPSSIFEIVKLEVLILSSNYKFTGEVSSAICKLNSLLILDLSNNSFTGSVPQCLGNMSLTVLHLGKNNFHGSISAAAFSKASNLGYLNFNGNHLQGRVPESILNCKNLEFLDLGNNEMDDRFPCFLGTLLELQILVLKSNKLHGSIECSNMIDSFHKVRIFDLSNNMFNGSLPTNYFVGFKAIIKSNDENLGYMRSRNYSFVYSVRLTIKGVETEFVKIQTLLTTIDLSGNRFTGNIPPSIGMLKSLKELNMSHNKFTGKIQASLRNLANLESLDLSSNSFTGQIPTELVDLTFLEFFNVSYNQLEGPIPEGKQFNTFEVTSYEGNLGLCGSPLKKACDNGDKQQQTPSNEDDSMSENGFGWEVVAIGYGCGVVFGLIIGYIVFQTRKPLWFVTLVEDRSKRRPKRSKRNIREANRR